MAIKGVSDVQSSSSSSSTQSINQYNDVNYGEKIREEMKKKPEEAEQKKKLQGMRDYYATMYNPNTGLSGFSEEDIVQKFEDKNSTTIIYKQDTVDGTEYIKVKIEKGMSNSTIVSTYGSSAKSPQEAMNFSARNNSVKFDSTGRITKMTLFPDNPQEKEVLHFYLLDIEPSLDVKW